MEKAYIVLAKRKNISHSQAKKLIDSGRVSVNAKRLEVARTLVSEDVQFQVIEIKKAKKLFEDENIIAVNKPPFMTSEEVAEIFGFDLLHRLDKETSGILLLVKDKLFRKKAIEEFRNQKVYKEYYCWVKGIVYEPIVVDHPIKTYKGKKAYSKIDYKNGAQALSEVSPLLAFGTKSKVSVVIRTGRTHQIRVHMQSINHPILGDTQYGGRKADRIFLHHYRLKLFDYDFICEEPRDFIMQEELV